MENAKVDRLTRVNELLKREIAEWLEKKLMLSFGGVLISVTEAKTSVDLRNATIMISIMGNPSALRRRAFEEIEKNRSAIQKSIARNLKFKHTPVLAFKLDERMSKGDSVIELLNKLENEE